MKPIGRVTVSVTFVEEGWTYTDTRHEMIRQGQTYGGVAERLTINLAYELEGRRGVSTVRNHETDLRYQASELKDDVQRLLHRAEQVADLAVAVTEQDMVSIAKVEAFAWDVRPDDIEPAKWDDIVADLLDRLRSEGGAG